MMRPILSLIAVVWLVAGAGTANLAGQEPVVSSVAQYADTPDGFKSFLETMLQVAKSGDGQALDLLVKQTAIPNDRQWFYSMYATDKADSWIGPYEKELVENQRELRGQFLDFAKSEGGFVVRKVNDNPAPGQGMEWGMLHSARQPLDIYFARWKVTGAEKSPVSIGYFYFIDGMFRWDSLVHFMPMAMGPGAVPRGEHVMSIPMAGSPDKVLGTTYQATEVDTKPRITLRANPKFTREAEKNKVEGTVVLSMVIDTDGRAKNITVTKSLGSGLDEAAVAAARQWRFTPGTKDGRPVAVEANVNLDFRQR